MRVLLVASNCSRRMGGEAILPYHYFNLLSRRGIDVRLLAHARNRAELSEALPELSDRVFYVEDTWIQRMAWRLGERLPTRVAEISLFAFVYLYDNLRMTRIARALVHRFSIDLVHQPIPVSPKEPSALHSVGAPVIFGPMNGGMQFPPGFKGVIGPLETLSLRLAKISGDFLNLLFPGKRRAALLLYANERTRGAFPKVLRGVKKQQLVENGVDLLLWERASRKRKDFSRKEFLFVGRLVDLKGVRYLLKGFRLAAAEEDIFLTIAGDGPDRMQLEALSRSLGLESRVTFLGFVKQDELPLLMARARALILPSIYECGGAVVLEAMAARTAVIASEWGGPLDYLDQSCGVLVHPQDEETFARGLADAMLLLTRDAALARALGEEGLARVQSMFTWDKKIDRIIELYREVLNTPEQWRDARLEEAMPRHHQGQRASKL